MSLLLRVTDINLWESCTLQHTHTEGKRESGGEKYSGREVLTKRNSVKEYLKPMLGLILRK